MTRLSISRPAIVTLIACGSSCSLVSSPCRRSSSAARCFGLEIVRERDALARMAASFRAARQSVVLVCGRRRRVRVIMWFSRWTGDFIRRGRGLKSPVAHAFRTLHVTAAAESRRKLRFALVVAAHRDEPLCGLAPACRARRVGRVCDNRPAALAAAVQATARARIRVARRAAGRLQCRCRRARHSSGLHPRKQRKWRSRPPRRQRKADGTKWDEGVAMVRACRDPA